MKLTTELTDSASVPYFFWDEELTVAELRHRLAEGSDWERDRLLGKMPATRRPGPPYIILRVDFA